MTKAMTMAELVQKHAYYGEWPRFRTLAADLPPICGSKTQPDAVDAQIWLRAARPGAAAVYYRGPSLALACEEQTTRKHPSQKPTLYLAGYLWAEAMYDRVDLVQRRIAPGDYEYIVIKRVKPPAMSMKGSEA